MLQLIDLMKYSVSAALLLYLCKGALTWKEKYARQGKYLFFLLFVVCGFWFSNSAVSLQRQYDHAKKQHDHYQIAYQDVF